ncbi:7-methylxanthosine synthase 1-like [Senna tora]|uniref:7-methylxanthosine synthase 1-like n=1 Tax=Senna tora TaxID=362788 RepID=A0A834SV87_9FABA|nr:7-methylxanthosine synthase 1-like [Senna tora]
MATEEVLHMNGGVGETSYANNSLFTRKVFMKVMPILKENITKVYTNINVPKNCLKVGDLGCSSGSNTFFAASEIMGMVDEVCLRLKMKTPEFHIFLNDLPSNDFNSNFKSLPDFHKKLHQQKGHNFGPCFIVGVPGSFYRRLFPENSIDFFHSTYSAHWLSQVPKGLIGRGLNKGNIYIAKTSPPSVWKAYCEQFEQDFKLFLTHRSLELVKGGGMVLTLLGRSLDEDEEPISTFGLIGKALHDMVLENKVEEAKLDSFDIPYYGPNEKEVRKIIEGEGSFTLERLEICNIGWDAGINEGDDSIVYDNFMRAKFIANNMRAVIEPLLKIHFGDAIMDELFFRFSNKLVQLMENKRDGRRGWIQVSFKHTYNDDEDHEATSSDSRVRSLRRAGIGSEEAARKFFLGMSMEEKMKVRRDEFNVLGYFEAEYTKNVRD